MRSAGPTAEAACAAWVCVLRSLAQYVCTPTPKMPGIIFQECCDGGGDQRLLLLLADPSRVVHAARAALGSAKKDLSLAKHGGDPHRTGQRIAV